MHCFIFPTEFVNDATGYPDMLAVPGPVDPPPGRLARGHRVLHLRHRRRREPRAGAAPGARDPPPRGRPHPRPRLRAGRRDRARVSSLQAGLGAGLPGGSLLLDGERRRGGGCRGRDPSNARRFGDRVEASNVEYGPAQVEVNLGHGPAHAIADGTMVFKYVVKQIAAKHGLHATFMPKPFMGEAGNGLHIHQSLRGKDGKNAFAVARRRPTGSFAAHAPLPVRSRGTPEGAAGGDVPDHQFLQAGGGLLFAPTQVCWVSTTGSSLSARSSSTAKRRASSARWASADANPYLVIAGCLAAGADGLERDIELPPMVSGDPRAGRGVRAAPRLSRPSHRQPRGQ